MWRWIGKRSGRTSHPPEKRRRARRLRFAALALALGLVGCADPPTSTRADTNEPAGTAPSPASAVTGDWDARGTGKLRAAREFVVQAPRLQGRSNRFTLVSLIANGSRVGQGALLARFDPTEQAELARTAQAQFDDLVHKIAKERAQNEANSATRRLARRQATADFEKATIQKRIAEVRSEIDRRKNEIRLENARRQVASLEVSHKLREEAEAAALRTLELQRDRQKLAWDRALRNAELLEIRAPLSGMVALEAIWRQGSRGPAQVGDQIYRGTQLMRIFDPTSMEVDVAVGEPDGAALLPGARADVILDAYPDLRFHARMLSASPVASTAIGSPIRHFAATFAVEETDPRLLPDLAAQVVIRSPSGKPGVNRGGGERP